MAYSRSLDIVRRFFPKVTKVRDAKDSIDIEVTPADIRSSATKDHNSCAVATACKRAMHLDGVIVSRSMAYLVKGGVATRYHVPARVTREVVAFDRGGSFEPGEYRLNRPDEHIALGHNRERGKPTPGSTKKHRPHQLTANIRTALTRKENGRTRRNGRNGH